MIVSARESLIPKTKYFHLHSLTHEFVIVDAGSNDGTPEWLAEQPDCRVVQHGERLDDGTMTSNLLGAVRAFNDGAFAARGEYVILANDDIEFIDDAIWRAWTFMQEHPLCGIGCFYQDRNHQNDAEAHKWHVEPMPCIVQGQQKHQAYGQVVIVPKFVGDRLGWWGDYLHTYGGDNELSCNAYVNGYQVLPLYYGRGEGPLHIPTRELGSCIHDSEPQDALRTINNLQGAKDPRAVRGHHPDSWKWGRKWLSPDKRMVGPIVRNEPAFDWPYQHRERFLYLPIYERGWPIQKQQKRGLREALAKVGPVLEYDYVEEAARGDIIEDLKRALLRFRPTICLFQLHNADPLDARAILSLREGSDAWWVNWNGDVWEDNLLSPEGIELARTFDLALTVNRGVLAKWGQMGIVGGYWQIGWEPDGTGHEPDDHCDVVFLANGYSPARQQFVKQLRSLPYSFRLWGNGWPKDWSIGQCTYDFITACKAYRGARFSIGDSQWPESGFVSNRVMQALAAGGSALCHQWFAGMELLGLVDGETCIIWKNFGELKDKLAWYHEHEDRRRSVAEAGERLALTRHSFDVRVRELLAMKPGTESWADWR